MGGQRRSGFSKEQVLFTEHGFGMIGIQITSQNRKSTKAWPILGDGIVEAMTRWHMHSRHARIGASYFRQASSS